jgi:hypothetical protein
MSMMATVKLTALLVLSAAPLAAQNVAFEYGSIAELKGITKVYVYTGPELKTRNEIVEGLLKDLPRLTIMDDPTQAEVIIQFGAISDPKKLGTAGMLGRESTESGKDADGRGYGWIYRQVDSGKIRLILQYKGTKLKVEIWKGQVEKFTDQVVSAFKKANQGI